MSHRVPSESDSGSPEDETAEAAEVVFLARAAEPVERGETEAVPVGVVRVDRTGAISGSDLLAVEEPLEIRLGFGPADSRTHQSISLTMRTPGNDQELAAGFLYTEGIITCRSQVAELRPCGPRVGEYGFRNVVRVELQPEVEPDLGRLQRNFYTTSSCGVCGKTSLEALEVSTGRTPLESTFQVAPELLFRLPDTLRAAQDVFGRTGGLHGAALFSLTGELLCVREDVGRHNALDKLIGAQLLAERLPLSDRVLLLSGRASFELLQKALMAGLPLVAAVGAPSSLAVELAERFGITLVGWLREERCSIFTHPERVLGPARDGV